MTLREQVNKLENDTYSEYERLTKIGDYNILSQIVKEYYDKKADNILQEIDENGIEEVVQNWDILECCDEIFYNDRRGDERMCYLLGVEKENGLYVYDSDTWQARFIPFSDLNGIYSKITVIEAIQNS